MIQGCVNMAFLFVDSLAQNNSRFVQMMGKILELLLLSVGLIYSLAVMKKAVLPYSCDLVFSSLNGFLTCIRCFLSSPPIIILLLINLVVLLIFTSSAFHGRRDAHHHHEITTLLDVDHYYDLQIDDQESPQAPPSPRDVAEVMITTLPVVDHESPPAPPPPPITRNNTKIAALFQGRRYHDVSSNRTLIPQPHEIDTKPSSSRTTEEKWKDVFIENDEKATENVDDTMEATWKAITGGGPKPKKKSLRKSETWDVPPPRRQSAAMRRLDSEEVLPTSPKWKELRKAETFNDAMSVMRRGGMIRRDPSMTIEEFNQKVEAFIENFNNNMKLQRQESHQRFLEKINHGRL